MTSLNLPSYEFTTREENGQTFIRDEVRKKWLVLTPEEWVRQNLIMYMHNHLGYPLSLIQVEKGLELNTMKLRADAVIAGKDGHPLMLIECKAPKIKIDQKVFDQISRYNISFRVPYLLISNGLKHFCCKVDLDKGLFEFLPEIPQYKDL